MKITGASSQGLPDVCSAIFNTGCDSALQSEFSSRFGLPLAGWGIIFYCSILLFLFLPAMFGKSFRGASNLLVYLLTLTGLIAAIVLFTVMMAVPSLFCPLCTVIHIINLSLFFFLNYSNRFSAREAWYVAKNGAKNLFSSKIKLLETRWMFIGLSTSLVLIFSLYFGLKILASAPGNQKPAFIDSKPIFAEFYSQPVKEIPVSDEDPMLGPKDSPVRLVIFSDFFCSSCLQFSKDLKYILEDGKGKYNIIFKHFPLSTECNNAITKNIHPQACEAALASVAAGYQGKFWEYHDSLFAEKPGSDFKYYSSLAEKTGLDVSLFEKDYNDEKSKSKILKDITLAKKLGIDATPTLYLNGRLIKDMRRGIPGIIMKQELKNWEAKDSLHHVIKDTLK